MKKILLTLCVLTGCGEQKLDAASKDNLKVISKTDLTDSTSVYEVDISGYRYIIVNGVNKIAIISR